MPKIFPLSAVTVLRFVCMFVQTGGTKGKNFLYATDQIKSGKKEVFNAYCGD